MEPKEKITWVMAAVAATFLILALLKKQELKEVQEAKSWIDLLFYEIVGFSIAACIIVWRLIAG